MHAFPVVLAQVRMRFAIIGLFGLVSAGEYADIAKQDVHEVCADIPDWRNNQLNDLNQQIVDRYAKDDNAVVSMITDEECKGDTMSDCISTHQSALISTAIKAVFPIVFPIIMLVLWLFFFMPCACCRCCRRCRIWCCCREDSQPRNFGRTKKIVVGVWVMMFLVGFVLAAIFGALSSKQMKEGGQGAICEVYRFVDVTLNGFTPPPTGPGADLLPFIGTNPAVDQLGGVVDDLDAGSAFLTTVDSLVDNTKSIENAVYEFQQTLTALQQSLDDNKEMLDFECVFCKNSGDLITTINQALSGSLSGLLKQSRKAVQDQLQGPSMESTRNTMNEAMKPIREIGKAVEDSLGRVFIDNRDSIENSLDLGTMIAIIISATVAIPGLLLLITCTCGAFFSRRDSFRDPNVRPQNACHASSAWCITCLWSFLVLLVTSVVLFVGFFGASVCIVLQDIDVYSNDLVQKAETDAETKAQMSAIMTNCFGKDGSGQFTNDIMIGGKTLKEALDVGAFIDGPFNELDAFLAGSSAVSLASDPNIVAFLTALDDWGAVFTPTSSLLADNQVDVTAEPGLTFAASQAACANRAISLTDYTDAMKAALNIPAASTTVTVFGQETFNANVKTAGFSLTTNNAVTCVESADVTAGGAGNELKFRNLAKAAIDVRDDISFECTTVSFATVNGYSVANAPVTGPCGNGSGKLADFEQYVTDMVSTLNTQVNDIDTATDATETSISTDLRQLVKATFTEPVALIVAGITCQFLGVRWNDMTDAICATMVPGTMATAFCWLAVAVIAWAAIFIEFNIWRRLKDNRGLWLDEVNRQRQ